jgi:hypothetical protein
MTKRIKLRTYNQTPARKRQWQRFQMKGNITRIRTIMAGAKTNDEAFSFVERAAMDRLWSTCNSLLSIWDKEGA